MNILATGSRGPEVLALQKALAAKGIDPGPLDGIYGERTQAGVVLFQKSQGIPGQGLAGPSTLAALGLAKATVVDSLPDAISFAGRSYHHIALQPDDLLLPDDPDKADEPAAKAKTRIPPDLAMQVTEKPGTLVRFAQLQDLWAIGRPSVLALWFRPSEVSRQQNLIYGVENHFRVEVSSGDLVIKLGDPQPKGALTAAFALTQTEWRHVALRFNAKERIRRNDMGEAIDEKTGAVKEEEGSSGGFYYDGYLVEVELYLDYALRDRKEVFFRSAYGRMPLQFLSQQLVGANEDNSEFILYDEEKAGRAFNGAVAQVEMWEDARDLDVEAIAFNRIEDVGPAMRWAPASKGPGKPTGLLNEGGSRAQFSVRGDTSPVWTGETDDLPPPPNKATRLAFAKKAVEEMCKTGVPDPQLIENADALKSPRDTMAVRELLQSFTSDELVALFGQGYRFSLRPKTGGGFDLIFALAPAHSAGIVLVEQYALTSFIGQTGRGRLVRTLSLAPGETTVISVNSYQRSEATSESAQSILDSYSDEASRNFERTLQNQQTTQKDESSEFAYHADISGQASWGWGSAQASAGVSGSINDSRSAFHDQMASAVQQHAQTTSVNREISVTTNSKQVTETGSDRSVERTIQNINLSRPLTTAFFQVNQEVFTFLHLTDVRVGFFDADNGVREEWRFGEAREKLASWVKQSVIDAHWPEIEAAVLAIFTNRQAELTAVDRDGERRDHEGAWSYRFGDDSKPRAPLQSASNQAPSIATRTSTDTADDKSAKSKGKGSAKPSPDAAPPQEEPKLVIGEPGKQLQFNRSFVTDLRFDRGEAAGTADASSFEARLPGLVMRAQRNIVRSDSLVCESILGDGWGLDDYSTRLQEAEAGRMEALAERHQAEAALLQARSKIAGQVADGKLDNSRKADLLVQIDPRVIPGETLFKSSYGTAPGDKAS